MAGRSRGGAGPSVTAVLATVVATLAAACGGPATTGAPATGGAAATTAATPAASPSAAATAIATASPVPATAVPTAATGLPTSGTWSEVAVGGDRPAAREDHTWTVDESGEAAWLFGGRDGATVHADLWRYELDSGTWARVDAGSPAPAARFGHEAAWVPGLGLVVTLGQAGPRFFDDIWLFDPATASWRELPAAGAVPVPRYGSCSGLAPDGRLWISHGFTEDGVRFADTRAYDFAVERWADVTPAGDVPVKRCLHACWWTADGSFVLYGGQTNGVPALGDLWTLPAATGSGGAWTERPDPEPAARQLAAVARPGAFTVVFGGRDVDRSPLRDAWILADGSGGFVPLATPGDRPSARSGAALVVDASAGRLLLFGGVGGRALDDLWSLTLD